MSKMPMLFVGHGSPMNAIEDNRYTRGWKEIAEQIPKPESIISISAHWYTKGTKIMNEENPKTIHDMYGFPNELYEILYSAQGNRELAGKVKNLISKQSAFDNSWGIDHGTWSVLVHMYPERNIPVFQISIDAAAPPEVHYQIGKELKSLRNQGVLLFGSGNIVHNLGLIDWGIEDKGFEWAYQFDDYIKESIINRNHETVINYLHLEKTAKLAVPTPEHFYPILYILGASDEEDKISVYNDSCVLGSLSMTSYLFT
ncbi:4,5-DOPA dioxygenase extradiol [Anaerocolumna sp. AGMB13025]|uniref:4,5-DOPA-extradiol-dioxygenase n=1 Tax=Anaerocolumna sp. AGMB13025 TaxID=3039116 RepID=UPI00241D8620|nr:4,5-DOPA dioxygenase extradiol [Anaerocolumna sp. AGMB13025]WFR58883.1 4,5-DOPA dioxygenase extradiol [Anaerocolumna sp. AGMB13025]